MHFEGPTAADIRNIRALNQSFLAATGPLAADRPLSLAERGHLASAPFLLFSLREQDSDYWDAVLRAGPQVDLVDTAPGEAIRRLQTAALGFVWQLARRNAYVARLVCGASPGWCERLAEQTLMGLVDSAADRADLLIARFDAADPMMQRLLNGGIRGRRRQRRMFQHLALQTMLTGQAAAPYGRLRAAACGMRPVSRRVAEHRRKV